MNVVQDRDPDDTEPKLKIIQRSDKRLMPQARFVERPQPDEVPLWKRKTELLSSYKQQLSPAARQVLHKRLVPQARFVERPQPGEVPLWKRKTELVSAYKQQLSPAAKQVLQTISEQPTIITPIPQPKSDDIAIQDMPTQRLRAVVEQAKEREAKKGKKKSSLGMVVRAIVTVLLFAFLLRSMNWSTLVPTITHISHSYLLLGLSAGVLCVFFSAYAWRSVVLAENIQADLAWLINLYLVGISFSHFLPTSMGGDAVKAYYVGRDSGNTAGAASAVLMSRITSFVGMLLIALPALAILHAHFTDQIITWFLLLSLLLIAAIIGSVLTAILLPKVSSRFLQGKWTHNRLAVKFLAMLVKVLDVGEALSSAVRRPRSMFSATLFGMLFWGASFMNYYGYALVLGLHVPLTFYVIAIPFVSIIAALPISINGFGVREGAFVYIFTTIHVPPTTSLSLALLMDAQVLFFGLLGGGIYLTMSGKKR
jgi:glycosyltransferase 2 family protein